MIIAIFSGGFMNEFLKNLRNPQRSQKPRYSATTRKGVEGNFYPSVDRGRNKEQRESQLTGFDDLPPGNDVLSQALPAIKAHLTTISSAVERMCETGEKLAETQTELHQAITCFFNNMNDILTEKIVPQAVSPNFEQGNAETPMADTMEGARFTKTEVIQIIREMREKRCTFGEIAAELKARAIPTFSGRGEWHAQTIHRLCRK
jgi:hypothetical protein